ncbi:MAG TPA: cytochrome C [Geobacter sp.]|nr:cytochrome C [Geobacter sp.]
MFLMKHPVAVMFLLGFVLSPLLHPGSAEAIPAFSRQHKTECSTCHTIYPELNEFGDAFLKNSYVWPAAKKGAAAAKAPEEKPGTEWSKISGLPEQIPISLTGTADFAYDDNAFDGSKYDLSTRSLRLHAGGSFRDVAGFFGTYNLYSQGQQRAQVSQTPTNSVGSSSPSSSANTPPNNTPNINELFLVWRHALDTPINLKVGRFEPKLSLWKKSNRVVAVPSYASTTYLVGNSPFSIDAPEDGIELNALLGNRVLVAGGLVDRNGQNQKDGYGHVSFKLGGTDFKGHEPEIDLEGESIWDFLTITMGAFGYWGRNGQFDNFGVAQNLNDFRRAGAEMDVLYKRLHLKGSGSFGRDSNPMLADTPVEFDSHAYSFEGEYYLGAPVNLIPLFRYEYQRGIDGGTTRYIPAIAYAPLQNTRLTLEYMFSDTPGGIDRVTFASVAFSL